MAQQQNQIYGYSSIYFDSPPFPPQNYQPPQNEQSNSRKRPSILGGNRVVKEPVEEKKIKITEENRIEVEKIMAATRAKKPHRALQSAHDPFMGNLTDSEEEEAALSDDEVEEIEDQCYMELSKFRNLLFLYSKVPPPKLGEEATANLPESPFKREFVSSNTIDWPPLDAMDGVMTELVPGTPLYYKLVEIFETPVPTQNRETVSCESKDANSRRRRCPDPSMKFLKKSPVAKSKASPSESQKLVQNVNIPVKKPVVERQTPVESEFSTSIQGSCSAKRPRRKNEENEEQPHKVSDLENLNTLKMFLHQAAPINVVDRENELLVKLKRQKKGLKSGGLLLEMLEDANCL